MQGLRMWWHAEHAASCAVRLLRVVLTCKVQASMGCTHLSPRFAEPPQQGKEPLQAACSVKDRPEGPACTYSRPVTMMSAVPADVH